MSPNYLMTPSTYDAWYATPRGRWIGDCEFDLLRTLLEPRPGETLLDVGCGTGYFSRRFAREAGLRVTGIDVDPAMIAFAHEQAPEVRFARADMEHLPFADASFDHVVAITSLCFVADEPRAVREMARVARCRLALGLLNRHSLLYLLKRRARSYAGAHWHSRTEAHALLADAGCVNASVGSAVFVPGGGVAARMIEHCLPSCSPFGGFLAVVGNLTDRTH
jgi:SAM-dependent methyltransferase